MTATAARLDSENKWKKGDRMRSDDEIMHDWNSEWHVGNMDEQLLAEVLADRARLAAQAIAAEVDYVSITDDVAALTAERDRLAAQLAAGINMDALTELVTAAMASGAVTFLEKARAGEVDPTAPITEAFGDFPKRFLEIRHSLVAALSTGEADTK